MKDLVYDSGDDMKTLLDWTATIAAFFPDLDKKVMVGYNDRWGWKYYGSGLDALLRQAKRKDKAGEWRCMLYKDRWEFDRWEFRHKRLVLDTLVIR